MNAAIPSFLQLEGREEMQFLELCMDLYRLRSGVTESFIVELIKAAAQTSLMTPEQVEGLTSDYRRRYDAFITNVDRLLNNEPERVQGAVEFAAALLQRRQPEV